MNTYMMYPKARWIIIARDWLKPFFIIIMVSK
jgi:hypothetical protein